MPHCRRMNLAQSKFGYLHSEKCNNSVSERPNGADDMQWKDRAFVLSSDVGKSVAYSDFYSDDIGCESHNISY